MNSQDDIKRIMLNTHAIDKTLLLETFGKLDEEQSLACMHDLLKSNR
jgi:hypothetical protein